MVRIFHFLVVFFIGVACTEFHNEKVVSTSDLSIDESTLQVIKGEAQGTTYTIKAFGSRKILKKDIDSLLQVIDHSMSNWNANSAITKFNSGEDSVIIDIHFHRNLLNSSIFHRETNGAFNPLVKPLLDYYGLGTKKSKPENIDSSVVESILEKMDLSKIKLLYGSNVFSIEESFLSSSIPDTIRLLQTEPGMQLDFNAIAQGYSVDVLAMLLLQKGATSYLIELGGEMVSRGTKPNGEKWRVGIDKPQEGLSERQTQATLVLEDRGIATSGNYRKFTEINGKKIHHTINPKTGFPADQNLLSATVVATTCQAADALATSFMVMGYEESVKYLESKKGQVEALLIHVKEDGELGFYLTEGLKDKVIIK